MDETLKANYLALADLAILSGLVYNLETITAIILEETIRTRRFYRRTESRFRRRRKDENSDR